ncbi:MAG: hypothetical protein QF767_01860, partial [Alphaproteobacteria bacterium]|nr:hypothetical protein [Alphaproteobacteria bacterium]
SSSLSSSAAASAAYLPRVWALSRSSFRARACRPRGGVAHTSASGVGAVAGVAGAGGGRAARRAARDFPPGALAELACDTPAWAHLAPGAATLRAFTTPKDIR